jgi:hypothetical protein
MEAGLPPSPAVMEGMGPLIGEMVEAGIFIAGEGLRPSSLGVRLRFIGGRRTITPGPLAGSNELIAAFSIVRAHSIEEAIEWASRFAPAGDAEIDVRPVTEAWDLGMMPRPAALDTVRYMIARKADRDSEAGALPNAMSDDSGAVLVAERIQPSSKGRRLYFANGKRTIVDGPFTESKELIAGYSIVRADSIDEPIAWASRFANLIGDVEIDIRPLYEP